MRDPHQTRQLARKLDVEVDHVTELVRKGMPRRDEQKAVLKRFIAEQIDHLDRVACEEKPKAEFAGDHEFVEYVGERRKIERRLSKVFALIAAARAFVDDAVSERLKAEGFSDDDILELSGSQILTVICQSTILERLPDILLRRSLLWARFGC